MRNNKKHMKAKYMKLDNLTVRVIREKNGLSFIEFPEGYRQWVDSRLLQPVFIDRLIRFVMDMGFTENQAISALKIGQYLLVCYRSNYRKGVV